MKGHEKTHKTQLLRKMMLIRHAEERILKEYRLGTVIGAIHLSIGQEATAVGVCAALQADDYVLSTHRGHGHAIAKGCDLERMMAELMGKDTGLCRGHGGSMHLCEPEVGFMGGNGIVGGGIPLALGPAFAAQYRGTPQVTVGFFSEGASNQGTFHESMNLASLWKLPVVYVCENNCYAATTPVALSCAGPGIAQRAAGYGVPGEAVDGNDVLEVLAAAERAVDRARGGEGPSLLECQTYRIEPHCGIIPDQRPPGERESWQERDPIQVLSQRLIREGIIDARKLRHMEAEIEDELQKAVDFAMAGPLPDPAAPHNRTWVVT